MLQAVRRHPLPAFFVLAYALSWACWMLPVLGYRDGAGAGLMVLGGFGPAVAAAVVIRLTGGSVRTWFRRLFRWRVAPRWYLFAIGVPVALVAAVTVEFALLGEEFGWAILDERLAGFIPSLVIVALIAGGNEEPGWRGFALPHLQDRTTPVRATLLLGAVWALWHLPLLFASEDADHGLAALGVLALAGLTLLSIVGYAFAYTYLFNRTGSVLLCILLHASFNTATTSAGLRTEEVLQRGDYLLMLGLSAATIWIAVVALIRATGGRLGRREDTPRHPAEAWPPVRPEPVHA